MLKKTSTRSLDLKWNVPQPLYAALSQIGNVVDLGGKETELNTPTLPISVAQNLGGYHASDINVNNHNLFEEIPSLGIAIDIVMALCITEPN